MGGALLGAAGADADWHRATASVFFLYGTQLACGGTLNAGTMGVAHRTLPCGARISLRRAGRTVTVPVVDRGPFVGGREFDLTPAAAARLKITGVVDVDWHR